MTIAKSTLKKYKYTYSKLIKNGYKPFMNYEQIQQILNTFNIKDTSKMTYFKSLLYHHKQNEIMNIKTFNKIQEFMKTTNKNNLNRMQDGKLTEKQDKNYVNWNDVIKRYGEIKATETDINILLASLYVLLPPRRVLDYTQLKIIDNARKLDPQFNYYVMAKKPYFLFSNYKTADKYGVQKVHVVKELKNIIDNYITTHNMKSGDRFFTTPVNHMSTRISKLFTIGDKKASVNILRHSYITQVENTGKGKTVKKRYKLAYKMGHSTQMQLNYYHE